MNYVDWSGVSREAPALFCEGLGVQLPWSTHFGKSRMKSDAATLAAGYASVLGFNLRQISGYQKQRLSGAKAKVA